MERETSVRERRYAPHDMSGAAPLAHAGDEHGGIVARARRAVVRWLKAVAVVTAVAYAAGWVVVTSTVTYGARKATQLGSFVNTQGRLAEAEAVRPFALPKDGAMPPDAAGVAFFRLGQRPGSSPTGFRYRDVGEFAVFPWREHALAPDEFKDARGASYVGGPDPRKVIPAVRAGLNAGERAVLRRIGTAPLWADFDAVARAKQVDVLGGRLVTPFDSPDAVYWNIPIPRFAATVELAQAGVARAAWHLSEGRRAEAERALRAVMSYGFVLIDDGTFVIDQLVGARIVRIGRDALAQLYTALGDPRAAQIAEATARAAAAPPRLAVDLPATATYDERRAHALAFAADPLVPRPLALEAGLQRLQALSCGNPRELVLGPSQQTRDAFAAASDRLARFPSEREAIRLIARGMEQGMPPFLLSAGLASEPVARIADLAGRIYRNPRLPGCMTVLADRWPR